MKFSKRMIVCATLLVALFSFSSVNAQRGDTAAMRQRMEARMQKMKDDLKLTPVQYDSITAISMEFQPKMREIMMDQSMTRDDKMAKAAPIREEQSKRIKAALGDDMYKKYQDWMEQNAPQRGGGGGGGRGNN